MSKRIISGLIVLMGLAILGVILVQLVWMSNAIKVSNRLFTQNINDALNNTVKKLEDRHSLKMANIIFLYGDSVTVLTETTKNTGDTATVTVKSSDPVTVSIQQNDILYYSDTDSLPDGYSMTVVVEEGDHYFQKKVQPSKEKVVLTEQRIVTDSVIVHRKPVSTLKKLNRSSRKYI